MPLLAAAVAALAASGLGGCSEGRCLPAPDWPGKADFGPRLPDRRIEIERFSVDSAGQIVWTGFPSRPTPVSLAELRQILAATAGRGVDRWLVLDVPPAANCATLRAVRAEMDKLPLCRSGRCVEGEAWDRSDPPLGL